MWTFQGWGHFKDGALKVCDEVCGKTRGGKVKQIHGGGKRQN